MRYLFCPLASHGFVNPMIGIALRLRSRGHEIAFATGEAFGETLRRAGFARIARGVKDGASFEVQTWWNPLSVAIQVKHVEHALRSFAPDVILTSQLAHGALIVGERHNLPVAVLGLAAYLYPSWSSDYTAKNEDDARFQWRHDDVMQHYNRARTLCGSAAITLNHLETPLTGDQFLLRSVPELEQSEHALPSKVNFVGSCLWEPEEEDAGLRDWLEEARALSLPVIYVQPGRAFDNPGFWSKLIAALGDQPIRVAASIGRMDDAAGDIPGNFFVRAHLAQNRVLPFARAVVGSGHTCATLGALTHGLPSLLLPSGSGSDDIAARCERAGAARCMSLANVTPESLGQAIHDVIGDVNLRRNAERLQSAFDRFGGCDAAAESLNNYSAGFMSSSLLTQEPTNATTRRSATARM